MSILPCRLFLDFGNVVTISLDQVASLGEKDATRLGSQGECQYIERRGATDGETCRKGRLVFVKGTTWLAALSNTLWYPRLIQNLKVRILLNDCFIPADEKDGMQTTDEQLWQDIVVGFGHSLHQAPTHLALVRIN